MKRLKEPERRRALLRAGRGAGGQARADRVPAAGPVQTRSRTSRELPGGAAGRSSLRIRVPRSGMVPARDPGGLATRNVALCLYEFAASRRRSRSPPTSSTSACTALGPYQGSYSDAALRTWAKRIRAWTKAGRDVYCYFDNDDSGYARATAPAQHAGVSSLLLSVREPCEHYASRSCGIRRLWPWRRPSPCASSVQRWDPLAVCLGLGNTGGGSGEGGRSGSGGIGRWRRWPFGRRSRRRTLWFRRHSGAVAAARGPASGPWHCSSAGVDASNQISAFDAAGWPLQPSMSMLGRSRRGLFGPLRCRRPALRDQPDPASIRARSISLARASGHAPRWRAAISPRIGSSRSSKRRRLIAGRGRRLGSGECRVAR